jgi:folate-dependent phosphoribosylglycinamide formyltransferase PurN
MTGKRNIAVMASGTGTTFNELARLSNKGIVNFGITTLLTNKPQAQCVNVAINHEIQTIVVTPENVWSLIPENTDLLVLAGWLKLLTVPSKWFNKVLNIHPSLLPKYGGKGFYGIKVHEAVIEAGETESGCTVHLVDNNYDTGRILQQEKISVRRFETPQTLQQRVQSVERELYPKVIDHYLLGLYKEPDKEDISDWCGL